MCKNLTQLIVLLLIGHLGSTQTYFNDIAGSVGLDVQVENTILGNGISFVDFNKDGWDDISVCTGPNDTPKFYLNIDGIFFTEVELNLGLDAYQNKQINWIDYNNDGHRDLFITSNTNGNKLFRNEGNLVFSDVTLDSGLPIENIFTYGASWADVNNDGCLDVYLSNHTNTSSSVINLFYSSNCDGTFTDATESAGLMNTPAPTFCSGFLDFNNDGWEDLYVANDRFEPNYLYKNNGDGSFQDVSEISGTGVIMDAMTVTCDDFNNDGFVDIYVTNTPDDVSTPYPGNALFKNNGDGTFTNISSTAGTMFYGFAWGASFLDMENDGDLDLYVSSSYDGSYNGYPSFAIYENIGDHTFFEPSDIGFVGDQHVSYGNAIGDFNNDGLPDLIVLNNNDEEPFLWANDSQSAGNYLKVELAGEESNVDGVGAVIEISNNGNKQFRIVKCGQGYLSQSSFIQHFGLGDSNSLDYVKVNWPSGIEDIIHNIDANQQIIIEEGSSLSLNQSSLSEEIRIFPTITKSFVYLESEYSSFSIDVYNSIGQKIYSDFSLDLSGKINFANFSTGTYLLKVKIIDADKVRFFRIIKD